LKSKNIKRARLHSLIEKRYLTEDEKLEEVRIKKIKLRLKDQMQMIEQDTVARTCRWLNPDCNIQASPGVGP
jgi:hypothetical protein